jgi:hypothetical protein
MEKLINLFRGTQIPNWRPIIDNMYLQFIFTFLGLHSCIGVCGEQCLDICAICNPEKFAEIKTTFLGRESEEGACFLQLQDCGDIFEANVSFNQQVTHNYPANLCITYPPFPGLGQSHP